MQNFELSKPATIGIGVVVLLVVGLIGWYFLGRQEKYPGFQAPRPTMTAPGPGGQPQASFAVPGMAPQDPRAPAAIRSNTAPETPSGASQ